MANKPILLSCGHYSTPGKYSTGYGTDSNGKTFCYECCAKMDREQMEKENKIVLYLTENENGYFVSNWPGSLKIRCYGHKKGGHNIASIRNDIWFFDHTGREWHGVQYGHDSQLCYCQKLKKVAKK